jgi:hypothetical protein
MNWAVLVSVMAAASPGGIAASLPDHCRGAGALALFGHVPTVHGLEFAYSLYPLPPGRMPFRRWRWELWHGSQLIAAGWRLGRADAGRALRVHAAEHGHKLFGLPAPPRDPRSGRGDLPPGTSERVAIGPITALLVPRALERPVVFT